MEGNVERCNGTLITRVIATAMTLTKTTHNITVTHPLLISKVKQQNNVQTEPSIGSHKPSGLSVHAPCHNCMAEGACDTANCMLRGDMGEQASSPMSPSSSAALLLCCSAPLLLCCSAAAAAASVPCLPPAAREVQQEVSSRSAATMRAPSQPTPYISMMLNGSPVGLRHASCSIARLCCSMHPGCVLWHTARMLTPALLRRHAAARPSRT